MPFEEYIRQSGHNEAAVLVIQQTREACPAHSEGPGKGASLLCVSVNVQLENEVEANNERKNMGLLGGYKEVSSDDAEVQEAANFAAEQLSQRSNSLFPFKVKEVCGLCFKQAQHRVSHPSMLSDLLQCSNLHHVWE